MPECYCRNLVSANRSSRAMQQLEFAVARNSQYGAAAVPCIADCLIVAASKGDAVIFFLRFETTISSVNAPASGFVKSNRQDIF